MSSSDLWPSLSSKKVEGDDFVTVCAPMVRYSKLAFRLLVKDFGVDLAYSPMILADAFSKSQKVTW